jgi:hypothetical protein
VKLYSIFPRLLSLKDFFLFIFEGIGDPISAYKESLFFALLIISIVVALFGNLLLNDRPIIDYLIEKLDSFEVPEADRKWIAFFKFMSKLFVKYLEGVRFSNIFLLPILAAGVGIYFYVNTMFLLIPQEYGGAKPRLGTLDIVRDSLSKDTLGELLPSIPGKNDNKIMRTKKMAVFFSGKDFLLIGPEKDSPSAQRRIELSKSSVKAINWSN